jgi:hypothetical protein
MKEAGTSFDDNTFEPRAGHAISLHNKNLDDAKLKQNLPAPIVA